MKHLKESDWRKIFHIRDTFVRKITGRTLYNYQRNFSNAIIKAVFTNSGGTFASEWSRQSGKTTSVTEDTVSFLLLYYFQICERFNIQTTPFFNIGFFAPQLQQAETGFNKLRDFLRLCEGHGFDFTFDTFRGNQITIKSKSYPTRTVYCMTASPTSKQESKTLNLIIFDESQDLIDKVVDKAIAPMGAMTNAVEVWIGVGGYQKCKFLRHIETLPPPNKFIFPYDLVLLEMERMYELTGNVIYLNYQKHINKKIRELGGTDNDEFKTQFALQWVLERGQFIIYDQLMALEGPYDTFKEYMGVDKVYGGIDWGKASDSTVFTIIDQDCHIVEWYEWQGDDYASQIEEIFYLIQNKYRSMEVIHCDSTGNQDMAVDILRSRVRQWGVRVEAVNFNASSKDEMYKNLSRLMTDKIVGGHKVQEAVFGFPVEGSVHKEKFVKQMLDLQKEIRNEKWRCNHPDGPGYHDDYCDSVALACMTFVPRKERRKAYRPMLG